MTLDDLTVDFRHLDRRSLLQEWEWLIGSTKLPILLTASGDAFVQDVEDGSVYVLDTGDSSIHQVASSAEKFQSLLGKRDFVGLVHGYPCPRRAARPPSRSRARACHSFRR